MELPINDYWTDEFLSALKRASSFEEVGEVGRSVIKTIKDPAGLSIPFTTGGYGRNINTVIIKRCIGFLEVKEKINVFDFTVLDLGLNPLINKWRIQNPGLYPPLIERTYTAIYKELKKVYRTPNWRSSEGCKKEVLIFKKFGTVIIPFPKKNFNSILKELDF